MCHTGTYRDEPKGGPRIVLGMPAHSLDLQKFFRFVIDCSLDERFNADNVIEKVREPEAASALSIDTCTALSWFPGSAKPLAS